MCGKQLWERKKGKRKRLQAAKAEAGRETKETNGNSVRHGTCKRLHARQTKGSGACSCGCAAGERPLQYPIGLESWGGSGPTGPVLIGLALCCKRGHIGRNKP